MSETPNQPLSPSQKPAPEVKPDKDSNRITNIIAACLVPAIICGVAGGYTFVVGLRHLASGQNLTDLGNFGSYLQGTTGSLWALAGVFIIFVAFLIQTRQLFEQREQFKIQLQRQESQLEDQKNQFEAERAEQQKEIEAQRQQFELQQASIKRQSFESSFFQLLGLQNQIVGGLRQDDSQGRDCFTRWYGRFKELRYQRPMKNGLLEEVGPDTLEERWNIFYNYHQSDLGHYFRNLYQIIKFVNTSHLQETEKRRYTSLARAQLSAFELALLFYDCLSPHGAGFKPLVERFGMLEHLDKKLLLDPSHEKLYAASAYQ